MPTRRTRLSRSWSAAVIATCLAISACSGGDDAAPPTTEITTTTTTLAPRAADGALSIGLMAPLTGPGATLGTPIRDAIVTAVAEINAEGGVLGRDIDLQIFDEEITRIDQVVSENIDALIGPTSSLVALEQLGAALRPGQSVVTCSPTATSLSLDDYPDSANYFFRTVPSDSMLMTAITDQAQLTGESSVAVAHLDDPYGRGLADAFVAEVAANARLTLVADVAFSGNEDDLVPAALEVVADNPGVVVVLGDADDGGRFLSALDEATEADRPVVIVNDTIRTARQAIQQLSTDFREMLSAVAPESRARVNDEQLDPFVANAIDCLTLLALATVQADSDEPPAIRLGMLAMSEGRVCRTFVDCSSLLEQGLQIDYSGLSGPVDLSGVFGDLLVGQFEIVDFGSDGTEIDRTGFTVIE